MTDEELIARLRSQIGDDVQHVYDHEALFRISADLITTLLAQNAALRAERDKHRRNWERAFNANTALEARAEAAEAEVEKLREYYEAAEAYAAEKTTGNGMRLVRARAALTTEERT